jgi:thiosulfate reductase cytochrome b subunit
MASDRVARPGAWPTPPASTFDADREPTRAAYQHPLAIRLTHWTAAVAIVVLIMSGLQIFMAFPSFGPKIPQRDLLHVPEVYRLGGWLAGGIMWHFTFMWLFTAAGGVYLVAQVVSGRWRLVLFRPRDLPGVWPMVRHYARLGPKPEPYEPYNPLQKLAYTATIGLGAVSLLSGLAIFNPVQFAPLTALLGGYQGARLVHFLAMCGFVAFIPGHLLMVAIHGWRNFVAMLVGWKQTGA